MNPPAPQPKVIREKRVSKPLRRVPVQRGKVDKPRKRLPKVKKTSRGKMGRLADKLFSLIVRARGACVWHSCTAGSICQGALQCAHKVSRSYRSVRWDEDNAVPLCAGAHVWTTHHPIEWEAFLVATMGEGELWALKRRALNPWDGDLEGVLVRLAARAVSLNLPVPK